MLIGRVSPPLRNTEKRRREYAPTSMKNLQMFRSLFTRLGTSGVQTLTFSVSRSFTVGNGVLVDILCVSQAARRCWAKKRGRHGAVRRGRAVPLSPLYIPWKQHRGLRPFTTA